MSLQNRVADYISLGPFERAVGVHGSMREYLSLSLSLSLNVY